MTKFLSRRRFDGLGTELDQDTLSVMWCAIGSAKALTKRENLVERAPNASESSGQASRRMTLEFAEA